MDMQHVAKLDIPEGEVRTIHDKDGNLIWGKVSYGVKYKGDTAQNGTPTPSAPVTVQTVTGEQTISINGAAHTVDLGSIELCKIVAYQDSIYKSGGKWYVHKAVGKVVLNGSESDWTRGALSGNATYRFFVTISGIKTTQSADSLGLVLSDKLIEITNGSQYSGTEGIRVRSNGAEQLAISTYATQTMTVDNFRTWLATNNIIAYYALATPTDTEIMDTALTAQLNIVEQLLTRYGYNATVTGNLPIIIDRTAL